MNTKELENVITAPIDVFLKFLREHAKDIKIDAISELCVWYCKIHKIHPEAKRFIAARIPGILINHYFTIREDLNYEKFIQFSIKTKNWADGIKKTAFSPKYFANEVESIIKKANDFEQ